MAVGRSERNDGLQTPFSIFDSVHISFNSQGQCLTGSSGNAPALDSSNYFDVLDSDCALNNEGVTPPFMYTTRDSTPTFTSSSPFSKETSRQKSYYKNNENIKTPLSPNPTTIEQVPDGGYLAEYISASYVTGSFHSSPLAMRTL